EEFAGHIPALIEAGASFVGGCCGTSPAFIAAVCRVLAARP
ncbi:MAG TPA: homocysteine S-methyltransferase family protein, partial [Candidatus Paceibacterota bacterium]|nr:homocysteine S-methyltransferase family protein [Candidatus Paceibacterota bacterium]